MNQKLGLPAALAIRIIVRVVPVLAWHNLPIEGSKLRKICELLAVKAAAYHAAPRVGEAWSVYLDAITAARTVGSEADISRVITEATLVWARYGGAFSTEEWKPVAADIVQTRLAEIGEENETPELAALLTGRSVWGRRALFDRTLGEVKADAQRAISISENLGSKRLLSHALDAYGMCLRAEGFCGLGKLADRMVRLGSEMPDRRQSHEMRISSAFALAEIGRYNDSRAVGTAAYTDAKAMSVHQRIHGIGTLTCSMVPNGSFGEILDASGDLLNSESAARLVNRRAARISAAASSAQLGSSSSSRPSATASATEAISAYT